MSALPPPPVTKTRLLLVPVLAALAGCVFVPRTSERYAPACAATERHMHLDAYQIAAFGGCRNQGCGELLVLSGAVSAASLVVSGSVVVVGEMLYWLEARAHCFGK